LRRHLSGRQAQIQRGAGTVIISLFNDCVEMYQVWFEDLQPALKLLELMLKFVLYLGGFACFVTDVNVHVCLGWENFPVRSPRASFIADSTPVS